MTLTTACTQNINREAAGLTSGIETQNLDKSVRAQNDFYRHVNGRWLDTTEIPADKAVWGSFTKLDEDAQGALRDLIETAANDPARTPGSEAQKIGDLYASFMDEAKIEALGLSPLAEDFARIDAIEDRSEIPALIAHLAAMGVSTPYVPIVHQDNKESTKYVVDLTQSGLGLPDRDYYLLADDVKLRDALDHYRGHVALMLRLAGDADATANAQAIVELETALAKAQWTKVENRDPQKVYNKFELGKLTGLAPGYDWQAFLAGAAIEGKVDYLIVSQPSYITGFNEALNNMPLPVWKAYFRWHLLSDYAAYLSKKFVDEDFAFYGTALRGVPENRPRWKRGVDVVEQSIGEGLGKLYVAKYFPPQSKARMEQLVANLMKAYQQSIDTLEWMSADTKKEAQAKLASFRTKIGYPVKWRDYSTLATAADDLVGNIQRAQRFEYQRNINKLGQPIDREEWGMTPQTVNAYYNPELNEIVFPAAILQPPFFNAAADDAVNYGGIGAVIGHEISHGFDDEGSQYDGDGNLRDWWSEEDHEKFEAKTRVLIEQYTAYEPVPGYHINGELTLGENIADNSGLAIAVKAYLLSLDGKDAPVIDALTGQQRLFMGWAQVWRGKMRENEAIRRVKIDPHSPPSVRGVAPLVNQPAFFEAFGVQEGDAMWRTPEQRVTIW
ncbi:MAG: M13 family peptidase [Gammaproteobacteria bacterium]|nr:M13 family peptidase [Gammaproteobacteria bacterium]